jgi:calcineurin-like phosphoesterase family protein
MIFFTSDPHFGHENIIKYCDRPFKFLEEMDETLIRNWNERVNVTDTVIVDGDFCFVNTSHRGEGTRKKWFWYSDQLNGNKVFIMGNHDRNNRLNTAITNLTLRLNKQQIFVTHRPSDVIFNYDIHLVGHVHNNWKHKVFNNGERNCVMVNVGVDVWGFRPVRYDEILHYLKVNNVSL